MNKVGDGLGEELDCVHLDVCVDEVRGRVAPEAGIVNRADLDEVFLLEEADRRPPACSWR